MQYKTHGNQWEVLDISAKTLRDWVQIKYVTCDYDIIALLLQLTSLLFSLWPSGELGSLTNVYKASLVSMMAGSDFIKTSTGKESVNATFPVALVMVRAVRDYYQVTMFFVLFYIFVCLSNTQIQSFQQQP